MRLRRNLLPMVSFIPIASLGVGCGDGPAEPRTDGGHLEVSTLSIGSAIDPDGYSVVLNGAGSLAIDANGSIAVSNIAPGQFAVELTGVAADCHVIGENPQITTVEADEITSISFELACPPFLDHIAFTSDRDSDSDFGSDIFVMNTDGTDPVNLTNDAAGYANPKWSPDGLRMAFARIRDGDSDIYVMDADGSDVVRVTNHPEGDYKPAWSPDGERIAFTAARGGRTEIYVMEADGSNQTNLTNHPAHDREPAWSPDGSRIAFISTRDPSSQATSAVYVMNADGLNPTRLFEGRCIGGPDWSPDGGRIAFWGLCDSGNSYEIVVMNADGSNPVAITKHRSGDTSPSWSPDGSRIAFFSVRAESGDVCVMNADGSNQVNLTNSPSLDGSPAWSPGP